MSALSLLIQAAIEQRIARFSDESLNLSGDPYGADARHRVRAQHWIAYQGSSYPEGRDSLPGERGHQQTRELEFQHFVEVTDLRRDYQPALDLHERLMATIAGFRPDIPGVRGPLRLANDRPVSARANDQTVYRYQASYRILCLWVPAPELMEEPPADIVLRGIRSGIFRSFVGEVAGETSVKDRDAQVEVEVE